MKYFSVSLLVFVFLMGVAQANIYAHFYTSEGGNDPGEVDFTVDLDYTNSPLAVANFIHLAGKGDDVFETAKGVSVPELVPEINSPHRFQWYSTSNLVDIETDTHRPRLRVDYVPQTETMRHFYAIYQGDTYIGGVEVATGLTYLADITGQDRIRLEALVTGGNLRYRITLRYPRPWLDARDQKIKSAPMYRNLEINRVETGKRFYAGSMTRSLLEHPGYHFQDEILRIPSLQNNHHGTPFNNSYVLAMDTLGPNKNGSRFFITTLPDPSLNGKYTAFGRVLQNAGRSVVNDIVATVTTADQLPDREMEIYNITFERDNNQPLTAAFFEGYHYSFMPGQIKELCLGIERSGSQLSLVTPSAPSSQISIYDSPDLVNFSGGTIRGQSPTSLEASLTDLTLAAAVTPKLFLKGFATKVPIWHSANVDLKNAQFSFKVSSGVDMGSASFYFSDLGTTGSYDIDMVIDQAEVGEDPVGVPSQGSGDFSVSYDFSQGPYLGVLYFSNVTGPLNVDQITLHLDSNRFANSPSVPESVISRRFDARTTDPDEPFVSYSGLYQKVK